LTKKKTNLLRIINHFTYNQFRQSHLLTNKINTKNFHYLLKKIPIFNKKESYITDKYFDIICNFYEDSNTMLEKDFGLNLDKKYSKRTKNHAP